MPLETGKVLNNRYRIVRLLGEGGFGAVYRAWDMNLKGAVAVKENLDTTPAAQKQFTYEAELLFKLKHPNLPRVMDHFSITGQGQYLVMDYVEGQDLQTMLEERDGSPLPEGQVLPWIEHVCDALIYLHDQEPSIVHRDVKPSNIKITPQGKAMLVDFGIAKVFDPGRHTELGAKAITPGYSPPEQYGGGTDAQSDIYALGATLYTLLTGVVPPDSIEIMSGNAPAPQPIDKINPNVSPQVSEAVSKAMQLSRTARWGSVGSFREALVQGVKREQATLPYPPEVTAPVDYPPSIPEPVKPTEPIFARIPWKPILAGALLLVVLVALVWGGISLFGGDEESSVDQTASAQVVAGVVEPTEMLTHTAMSDRPATSTSVVSEATTTSPPELTDTPLAQELPVLVSDEVDVPMRQVPAGEFQMGSTDGEANEEPVHRVQLGVFYIDQYEVTNANYAECVAQGACQSPASRSSESRKTYYGNPLYDDYPVLNVTWDQAQSYCDWRNGRLPTEAEWEKAARGGLVTEPFPWGDETPVCEPGIENGAKFDDNANCNLTDTEAVGTFAANGYGLYDMAGNLWEWVADWYAEDYYTESPDREPGGPQDGDLRVIRGGSWSDSDIGALRTASREGKQPDSGYPTVGFRCVREIATMEALFAASGAGPSQGGVSSAPSTPTPTSTPTQTFTPTTEPTSTPTRAPILPSATPTRKPKPTEPPEPPTEPPPPTATPAP